MNDPLSSVELNFSPDSLLILNIALGFIMFGVSLGINKRDFILLRSKTKAVATGVFSQFVFLPFLTFLLVYLINPLPSLALGMILVAACPGGNVSNFFSSVAKGNVALSVTLTAIASIAAVIMTPTNFQLWGGLLPHSQILLQEFSLSFFELFKTVLILLAIPLVIGLWFSNKFPGITLRIQRPIRIISFLILLAFIGIAFSKNVNYFLEYFDYVIYIVFIHNGLALLSGFLLGRGFKNSVQDSITISIETGIQNSGLALIIIFTFFNGNGGMSIVAAWWGIWHIISGLTIGYIYKRLYTENRKLVQG